MCDEHDYEFRECVIRNGATFYVYVCKVCGYTVEVPTLPWTFSEGMRGIDLEGSVRGRTEQTGHME